MQIVPYLKVKNIWAELFLICADALGRKCQTSFIAFYRLSSHSQKKQKWVSSDAEVLTSNSWIATWEFKPQLSFKQEKLQTISMGNAIKPSSHVTNHTYFRFAGERRRQRVRGDGQRRQVGQQQHESGVRGRGRLLPVRDCDQCVSLPRPHTPASPGTSARPRPARASVWESLLPQGHHQCAGRRRGRPSPLHREAEGVAQKASTQKKQSSSKVPGH